MKYRIINFLAFQAAWFACVLGAANGVPLLGPVVVGFVICLHLGFSARVGEEIRLMLIALGMGLIIDSLLVTSGWLKYPNGFFLAGVAPYWILTMWASFATTLNSSMSWIKVDLKLAAAMGAVFGPLSYLAGQRLGALFISDPVAGLISLALAWGIAMPLLVLAARKFDGFVPRFANIPVTGHSEGLPG